MFNIEYGNVFDFSADAIVIPVNSKPVLNDGLDSIAYSIAGKNRLIKDRRAIGEIPYGKSFITDSYDLKKQNIKYIIHTAVPYYDGGKGEADELLKSCYESALGLAVDNGCKSIVFALLKTEIVKYPDEISQQIAESVFNDFLLKHELDIKLVIYDGSKIITKKDRDDLSRYLAENCYALFDYNEYKIAERKWSRFPENSKEYKAYQRLRKQYIRKKTDEQEYRFFEEKNSTHYVYNNKPSMVAEDLTYFNTSTFYNLSELDFELRKKNESPSFKEVFEKFREKNNAGKNAIICQNGNLREDTLCKLLKGKVGVNREYLWALAVALKINMDETEKLFNSCGLSTKRIYISNATKEQMAIEEKRERIFQYCITNGWGIYAINKELEKRKLAVLGNKIL